MSVPFRKIRAQPPTRASHSQVTSSSLTVLSFSAMFTLFDRYLIREIARPLLLALLVFTFILMVPPLMDVAEELIAKGVPFSTIARIMLTLIPQALGITIPMSFLVGLLVALGRLEADREIVVLQACGVSLSRLLRPILSLATIAALATAYVLVVTLPNANQSFRELTYSIIALRAQDEVKARVFYEDFPNVILYVRDAPLGSSEWTDVFVADTRNPDRPDIFLAERGRMLINSKDRRVGILLENGAQHQVAPDRPEEHEVYEFERMVMSLDPETVFPRVGPQRGYPELTLTELRAEAIRMKDAGLSPHRPIMELHRKFSIPTACFVFALIGLAFGVRGRKDGKLPSFAIGIAFIFAYYVFMYLAEAGAKGSVISPHLAMWIPNLALGIPGLLFVWQQSVKVHRQLSVPAFFRFSFQKVPPTLTVRPESQGHVKQLEPVPEARKVWMPRLNLLDRYVLRHYLRVASLSFVGMLGIFYIATFIDLSDKLFKGETTGQALLEYFWYATPQYIYYVLPISALVATLVTIGLLTKTSELVVIKACGISLYRAAAPLVLFGALLSGVLFGLGETILASSNRRAEAIRHVIRGGSPQTFDVLNRKWIVGPKGAIYHYTYLDPERLELNGLSVFEFAGSPWRLRKQTFVNKIRFVTPARERRPSDPAGVQAEALPPNEEFAWDSQGIWVRSFDDEPGVTPYRFIGDSRITETSVSELTLPHADFFVTERPDADRMNFRQLERYIGELQASGFGAVQLLVALQRKLSFPVITIVMTLIGIPFAVMTGRRGAMYAIGIGLIIAIAYWITISVFGAVGAAGLLTPVLAAWAPNILFSAGAGYLLLTVRT